MKEVVWAPIFFFFQSIGFGMLILFLYDSIEIFRSVIKHPNVMRCVEDVTYWILVAGLSFETLYYYNWGEIRGFFFVGVIFGMAIYHRGVSPIFMKWCRKVAIHLVKFNRFAQNGLKDKTKEYKITMNSKRKRGESNQENVQKRQTRNETKN